LEPLAVEAAAIAALLVVETVRAGTVHSPRVDPVLDRRLAQLSPAADELAGLGAAVGRDLSLELLAAACCRSTPRRRTTSPTICCAEPPINGSPRHIAAYCTAASPAPWSGFTPTRPVRSPPTSPTSTNAPVSRHGRSPTVNGYF
jgi:hypothetical protein